MDFNEQLRLLQAAQGDPQKVALATLDILLASQPPELRRAFEAATIPHWFDERLLAALLDEDLRTDSQRSFLAVVALPAVEPFPARQGYNVHEATRLALRRRLFTENPQRFRELAACAVAAFSGSAVHEAIERVYHLLVAEPQEAGPAVQQLHLKLVGRVEETLGLARVLDEYADCRTWPPQARGWAFLLSARYRGDYRPHAETSEAAAKALQAFTLAGDEWASALAHCEVGESASTAGKLADARSHFEEFHRIAVRLAAADPSNAGWQRDLRVSCWRMAATLTEQSGTGDALEWWRKAYETLSAMKQRGMMLPTDEQYLERLRQKAGAS